MLRLFNFLIDDIVQAFGSIGSSIRDFSLIHWLCLTWMMTSCLRFMKLSLPIRMKPSRNVRNTTEEASVRVTEAEPLDDSRDHENASMERGDPESYDINVEPQMSEDISKAQEEHTVRETICTIVRGLVDPHGISDDNFSSVFILSICDCLL
ncbi:PREDICTED: sister chromatid cohesion 1 protein 2-like isoform X1 [Camelina sativa]|uniref:Sister chromatid cohesion 1 protein 2-like isoform X1 n=1 Tax=Camelina sativa TaxID=90675 RepID=A0ABM1QIB4_CAMSA|nr:PREDICTED: sister chromatid cohesion 1 protein 2-like isoform X1 [Camelina sativa]